MKLLLFFISITVSLNVFAFPKAPFDAFKYPLLKPEGYNQFYRDPYDFEGIVKLHNCSGSLVHFAGQPASSNAYVLTNGHCVGKFIDPGKAVINQPTQRKMYVANSEGKYMLIQAQLLMYATMTGTDAAIYELNETYEQIYKRTGVRPLTLAYERPPMGLGINILSGYWERGYSCQIKSFIYQLAEAGWIFNDSIKYSQPGCDTIGGTSGSPIIAKNSRVVVGVNNTGNNDGQRCTMNNPCEVDKKGNVTVDRGASYGQQTFIFYYCLTADHKIDTRLRNCPLTK